MREKKPVLTAEIIKKYLKIRNRKDFLDIFVAIVRWGSIAVILGFTLYYCLSKFFKFPFVLALIFGIIPMIFVAAIVMYKFYLVFHRYRLIKKNEFTVIVDKVTGSGHDEHMQTLDTIFFSASRNDFERALYMKALGRIVVKEEYFIACDEGGTGRLEREYATFQRTAAGDIMYLIVFNDHKEKVMTIYNALSYDLDSSLSVSGDISLLTGSVIL